MTILCPIMGFLLYEDHKLSFRFGIITIVLSVSKIFAVSLYLLVFRDDPILPAGAASKSPVIEDDEV